MEKASESDAIRFRSLTFGFGYPFSERAFAFPPLGPFFSPQRSWAYPFRALFLSRGRKNLIDSFFPLVRFLAKRISSLAPALQWLSPPSEAVLLIAARWIRSSRRRLLSWGLQPFRLSLDVTLKKSSFLFFFPFHSSRFEASQPQLKGVVRFSVSHRSASPSKGRQPIWFFWPTIATFFLKDHPATDYFFILEPKTLCRYLGHPLCSSVSSA